MQPSPKKVPKDRKIDRHRPGYWRDYMRKYRAKLKGVSPQPREAS